VRGCTLRFLPRCGEGEGRGWAAAVLAAAAAWRTSSMRLRVRWWLLGVREPIVSGTAFASPRSRAQTVRQRSMDSVDPRTLKGHAELLLQRLDWACDHGEWREEGQGCAACVLLAVSCVMGGVRWSEAVGCLH
jgi:hypothetical protein